MFPKSFYIILQTFTRPDTVQPEPSNWIKSRKIATKLNPTFPSIIRVTGRPLINPGRRCLPELSPGNPPFPQREIGTRHRTHLSCMRNNRRMLSWAPGMCTVRAPHIRQVEWFPPGLVKLIHQAAALIHGPGLLATLEAGKVCFQKGSLFLSNTFFLSEKQYQPFLEKVKHLKCKIQNAPF